MNTFKIKKIKGDSLGEKLNSKRLDLCLSLQDVYDKTKIPVKYLEFLEKEEWNKLPGKVYIRNFLKKYCSCLGLNQKLCIRQYEKQISKILKSEPRKKSILKKFLESITPNRLMIILLVIGIVSFVGYIGYEISNYIKPPEIKIIYPEKEFTTMENIINIKGQTEKESILFVNGEAVGVSDAGDFSFDVNLKSGLNKLDLVSQKKNSRKSYEQIIIYKKE